MARTSRHASLLPTCPHPLSSTPARHHTRPPPLLPATTLLQANWAVGGSDHLAVLGAFSAWEALPRERERREFCSHHFLSSRGLEAIAEVKRELLDQLAEAGFVRRGGGGKAADPQLLKVP